LAEVADHPIRLAGAEEDDAVLDLAQLDLDSPSPVDAPLGLRAGSPLARRYHRKD
jgi:hypothetical protein